MNAQTEEVVQEAPRSRVGRGRKAHAVDAHVGQRMRQRRVLLGMSLEQVADALDLTYQQVQKYERAANRISAGRLYAISQVLDVPVSFFFDGLEPTGQAGDVNIAAPQDGADRQVMEKRETLELLRAYYHIQDRNMRRRLVDLIRAVSNSTSPAALEQ